MNERRQEALTRAYRQLASGLSALLRAYREVLPEFERAPQAREMIAGALTQLEELGVSAVYVQEENPPGRWLEDPPPTSFSIEWAEKDPGPCSICAATSIGRGPVGWLRGSGAVCDGCMLERAWGLGSMLLAVNAMREIGALDESSGEDLDEATVALTTYARLYERVAANRWPFRPVGLLQYLRHLSTRFDELFPRSDSKLDQLFKHDTRGNGNGKTH